MPLGRNFILFWNSIALRDSTRSWFLNTVTPSGICFFCLIICWSEEIFPRAPKINVCPRTGSNTDGIAPCKIMIFSFYVYTTQYNSFKRNVKTFLLAFNKANHYPNNNQNNLTFHLLLYTLSCSSILKKKQNPTHKPRKS